MKIFLVCNSLSHGGAERVGAVLANGFTQQEHEVYHKTEVIYGYE